MTKEFDDVSVKSRRLTQLLADVGAGKRPLGMSTAMNCPVPLEVSGRFGFQWVVVDQEHTLLSSSGSIDLIRAAELSECVVFVKVNEKDPLLIRDALDAGASGIQMPGTDTAEELLATLDSMRYRLRGGSRGVCPIARTTHYFTSKYSGHDNWQEQELDFADQALLIPTVESVTALRNIEEMLKIDECPVWHIGPMDLGQSMGLDQNNPAMADVLFRTVRQLAQRIHNMGKFVCYPVLPTPIRLPEEGEEGPFQDPLALAINAIGVDMPYTIDSACLGLGMSSVIHSRNFSNAYKAEDATSKQND